MNCRNICRVFSSRRAMHRNILRVWNCLSMCHEIYIIQSWRGIAILNPWQGYVAQRKSTAFEMRSLQCDSVHRLDAAIA